MPKTAFTSSHFWTPWCHPSKHEPERLWAGFIAARPDVSFRFVTVYHSGALAGQMRDDCGVPDRGVRLAQPDYGSSSDKAMRRRQFLGLPLTWTPTTCIFHNNGQLAYAVDSGEVTEEMTDTLLRALTRRW